MRGPDPLTGEREARRTKRLRDLRRARTMLETTYLGTVQPLLNRTPDDPSALAMQQQALDLLAEFDRVYALVLGDH